MKNVKSELNKTELVNKLKTDSIAGTITEIENGLVLKTGISMSSWGEKIKINLLSKGDNDFDYQVSSSPLMWITIIDFGKNLENVEHIESLIKSTT